MPDKQPSFLRSVMSGPDGSGSASRFCVVTLVLSAEAWVSYLVVRTGTIPPLGGLTLWLTTLVGSLYGTNKITGALSQRNTVLPPQLQEPS